MRYDLDALRLATSGKRLDANLIDSVVSATWERSIEGASTLDFTLDDPDGALIESALLTRWAWGDGDLGEDEWIARGRRIDVRIGAEFYRLSRVSAQGTQVSLTFEDRDVARLREMYGARKMARAAVTRAQFGRVLVAELKHPVVPVHIPELHVRQPVARQRKAADAERNRDSHSGIDPSTPGLTVKGQRATRQQIKVAEELLDSVYSQYPHLPQLAVVAILCVATHESVMGTLGMTPAASTDGDSVGILQARTAYVTVRNAESIPYNVQRFMVTPWTGTTFGGAIKQARAGRSLDEITTSIQGNATGTVYSQWKPEALKWLAAYNGGGGRVDESSSVNVPYQYERKPKENTWDCLGRLYGEVNWRRFMREGRLWIASEESLFRQRPALRVRPGDRGIESIDFDLDTAARSQLQEATLTARAGVGTVQPGQIAVVERRGPANGRWLVSSVSGNFGEDAVTAELRKPVRQKAEPAAKSKTVSRGHGLEGATSGGVLGAVEAVYNATLQISEKNYPYVWGGGHATAGKPSGDPAGYDCSGYSAAGLKAGGFLPDAWASGVPASTSFESLGIAGEGKYMTVWANAEHVWIEFHLPGRRGTRADTSPHGSGGDGPHMRYTRRSTAGFVARHFQGT